jgi:hypothetical protein
MNGFVNAVNVKHKKTQKMETQQNSEQIKNDTPKKGRPKKNCEQYKLTQPEIYIIIRHLSQIHSESNNKIERDIMYSIVKKLSKYTT